MSVTKFRPAVVPTVVPGAALDSVDRQILKILLDDGRITNSRLALEVGLSESATCNRVRRLEQAGVIQGYRAVVAQKAFGSYITIHAQVVLESHKHQEHSQFEQLVARIPEITECTLMTGPFDYNVTVVARDMNDYMRVMDGLAEAHGRVSQYFSNVAMRVVKQRHLCVREADSNG